MKPNSAAKSKCNYEILEAPLRVHTKPIITSSTEEVQNIGFRKLF
jgi:hypothetical protein